LEGVVPVTRHLDHVGPMGQCVSDLAFVLNAIDEQGGPRDSRLLAGESPVCRAARFITFREHFDELADEEVRRTFREAVARLRAAGATIDEVEEPYGWTEVVRSHRVIMAVEAAETHALDFARHADQYGFHVGSLIREGLAHQESESTTHAYERARQHQTAFQGELDHRFGRDIVALTPSTVTPAPTRDSTGDPRFNSPWSFAGTPSVTIPCGLSADGLPCGLQLHSARHTDYQLLDTAAWCESCLL